MDADLLGGGLDRRRRGRHERLVGRRRGRVRAEGFRAEGRLLRPRAAGADPGAARRPPRAASWSPRATETLPPGVTPWSDVIAKEAALPDVAVDPDADACIFYTSGTTGRPKGAQLTHRGCITNLMNMMFAGQATALAMQKATGVAPPETPPTPVSLLTTPLFHVTANNCGAYAVTAGGGTLVLMYKWDAGEALKLIERERVTGMSGVPVMSREILTHPDFATRDTSSLTVARRRRRAAAAGPGGQDRRRGRHRAAEHRLRHDRDLRHHHRGQRRLLRRPSGQLRPGDADLRGQVRR